MSYVSRRVKGLDTYRLPAPSDKMRYVSQRKPATVRERIEDLRKRTPPPEGRKARRHYASKDDFAAILGIGRSRIYAWTRTDDPEYPDEISREKLAALSDGRYRPSDFVPGENEAGSLSRRIDALQKQVERLERHIFGQDAAQAP